ncbi:hypothetical protein [Amycolatopsis japonica]|uniref:hypothetical protein n=1 Tax=Amycolatopsis japonica TaxID=208439 RepID=UPI00382284C7
MPGRSRGSSGTMVPLEVLESAATVRTSTGVLTAKHLAGAGYQAVVEFDAPGN